MPDPYYEISRITQEHLSKPENRRAMTRYFFGYPRIFKHPTTGQWLFSPNWPMFGCRIYECRSWTDAVNTAKVCFGASQSSSAARILR
jgi:hypothetical protein